MMGNGTVIQQLVVELDGRTVKLEAAMKDVEKRMQASMRRVGTETDGVGVKYGDVARKAATAGEAIARTGKVSAESVAGLATQLGGPLTAAIGIASLAFISMFTRAREEARKTREKIAEEMGHIADITTPQEAGKVASELYSGTPGARAAYSKRYTDDKSVADNADEVGKLGLVELRRRLAELEQIEQRLNKDVGSGQFPELEAKYQHITHTIAAFRLEEKRLAEEHAAALKQLGTTGAETGTTAVNALRIDRDKDDAAHASERVAAFDQRIAAASKKMFDEMAAQMEGFGKELDGNLSRREEALAGFAGLIAKTTATAADEVSKEFDEWIKKLHLAGLEAEAIKLTGLKASVVESAKFLEGATERFEEIKRHSKDAADEYNKLKGEIAAIEVELGRQDLTSADRVKLQKHLNDLIDEQNKALGKVTDATGGVQFSASAVLKTTRETALAIQQAVDGALQLASAFGAIDERAASVLRGVGQIAANSSSFVDALTAGKMGGETGIVATALPIAGAIASIATSLFGGSAEARKKLRDDIDAWHAAIDEWVDGMYQAGGTFATAVHDAHERFKDGQKELDKLIERAVGPRRVSGAGSESEEVYQARRAAVTAEFADEQAKLNAAVERAIALARIELAQREAAYIEDLRVQTLRLRGRDEAAGALAVELEFQQRLNEAKREGYGPEAVAAINAWHDAMVAATEATRAAADRQKAGTRQEQEEDLFDITDPAEIIRRRVAMLTHQFGDLFAHILDGIDLATPEGIDEFNKRLIEMFSALASMSPEELAAMGIDEDMFQEIIEAILGLEHTADDAADGIVNAANRIATIDVSQFGPKTKKDFQDLQRGTEPEADDASSASGDASSAGTRNASTNAWSNVTTIQADRMTEFTRQTAINTSRDRLVAAIRAAAAPYTGPPLSIPVPPSMTYGAGGSAAFQTSSAPVNLTVSMSAGAVVVQVLGAGDPSRVANAVGDGISDALVRKIDERLRALLLSSNLRGGNITV